MQCHFGLDTLSWARLGAEVVGVDFSQRGVEAANALAKRVGLEGRARFVLSDVLALDDVLNEQFDIVFTSVGAICWMSDIDRWAAIVARFVSPSGFFYVLDDHPVGLALDQDDNGRLVHTFNYFSGAEPHRFQGFPDYSDPSYVPEEAELSHIWPVSEVMRALEGAGMGISEFKEYPYMRWKLAPDVEEDDHGNCRLLAGDPALPLMYSFKARHRRGWRMLGVEKIIPVSKNQP